MSPILPCDSELIRRWFCPVRVRLENSPSFFLFDRKFSFDNGNDSVKKWEKTPPFFFPIKTSNSKNGAKNETMLRAHCSPPQTRLLPPSNPFEASSHRIFV